MLLTFLYHRVNIGKYSNKLEILQDQLEYLSQNYQIVLPGDKLNFLKINICLTFDDGFYDFYYYVFPILKKLNIKALLSVPPKYILDNTDVASDIRLNTSYNEAIKEDNYITKAPFCTYKELKEMIASNLVQIASHSYSHVNLIDKNIDLNKEIIESMKILEKKLQTNITTFVYPFGKFNKNVHSLAKKHYRYIMRIGSCINFSWNNFNRLNYRIISDRLKTVDENLKPKRFFSYIWLFFINSIRKR